MQQVLHSLRVHCFQSSLLLRVLLQTAVVQTFDLIIYHRVIDKNWLSRTDCCHSCKQLKEKKNKSLLHVALSYCFYNEPGTQVNILY
jgi:hypothetical protein